MVRRVECRYLFDLCTQPSPSAPNFREVTPFFVAIFGSIVLHEMQCVVGAARASDDAEHGDIPVFAIVIRTYKLLTT